MQKRSTVRNAALLIGQPLIINIIGIPATAYFIHTLGATGFGQWSVGTSLIAITAFLANLGLRPLFIRRVSQFPEQAAEATYIQLALRILLAIFAGFSALGMAALMGYSRTILICVAINAVGLLATTIASTLWDVMVGFQRFKAFASMGFAAGVIVTVVSVVSVFCGARVIGLSVAYLSGILTSLMLACVFVHRNLFPLGLKWNTGEIRKLLSETKFLGMELLMATIRDRSEQLLVPKLLGVAQFGYFSAGTILADRLRTVPDGLATSMFPGISKSYAEKTGDALDQVLQLMLLSLLACIPIAVLITVLANPIAHLLFRKNAEECQAIIQITIWSVVCLGIFLPMGYAIQAAGKSSEAARLGMAATIVSTMLTLILILQFGLKGACYSWVLRPAVSILFLLPCFMRTFPALFRRVPFGRILLCAVLMALPLLGAFHLQWPILLEILLGGTASLLVYGGMLLGTKVVNLSTLVSVFKRG